MLRQYNYWESVAANFGFSRQSYLAKMSDFMGNCLIKVLTGQRRAGKSYLLRQILKSLIDGGVNPLNTFFLNKDMVSFDFVRTYVDLVEGYNTVRADQRPATFERLICLLDE